MQSIFLGILSIMFLGLTIFGLYTTFSKKVHDDYFDTLIDGTTGYILFFGLIGKWLLWICKKLFPKKYYIVIFRGIIFTVNSIFLSFAAGIWFVDWNMLF
ncbi:DNA-binding protein [Bacillus cereus]|uniref:DNA-binding protein n=1 Tax=Bacillus cereus TaxID=1396 RepID=A0A2A8LR21_BACCE|nr:MULTISPECIES: DNA-binding protein [Bacillus cereus group]MDR4983315.1 DNA-binding protein [Bacillus cereus]MEA1008736.1 DNA-binding protein [Bacillus cereus]PES95627.1 DNA-binding protein [Bacillus cereus]PFP72530.1 DNA-binding protein [Bacillus cereus]PGT17020.1 DNA-binding protein [Bacillus cereus]